MKTFVPFAGSTPEEGILRSLLCLDDKRLGKQRVESTHTHTHLPQPSPSPLNPPRILPHTHSPPSPTPLPPSTAYQIWKMVRGLPFDNTKRPPSHASLQPLAWSKHPAVAQWVGYADALALYLLVSIRLWASRLSPITGRPFNNGLMLDNIQRWRIEYSEADSSRPLSFASTAFPPWWGDPRIHDSDKGILYRKDRVHYAQFRPYALVYEQYCWPYQIEEEARRRERIALGLGEDGEDDDDDDEEEEAKEREEGGEGQEGKKKPRKGKAKGKKKAAAKAGTKAKGKAKAKAKGKATGTGKKGKRPAKREEIVIDSDDDGEEEEAEQKAEAKEPSRPAKAARTRKARKATQRKEEEGEEEEKEEAAVVSSEKAGRQRRVVKEAQVEAVEVGAMKVKGGRKRKAVAVNAVVHEVEEEAKEQEEAKEAAVEETLEVPAMVVSSTKRGQGKRRKKVQQQQQQQQHEHGGEEGHGKESKAEATEPSVERRRSGRKKSISAVA